MNQSPKCQTCKRPVRRVKDKHGNAAGSMDLDRMDPDQFFCTIRCAAKFGIACARAIKNKKQPE